MEFPDINSHSELGVFAPNTDESAYPFVVFSFKESINGVSGMLVCRSPNTLRSENDSFIMAMIVGFFAFSFVVL